MTEVLEMEKRKLNDEVNRLLRDLVFQKLAMELAEIINGSWDLRDAPTLRVGGKHKKSIFNLFFNDFLMFLFHVFFMILIYELEKCLLILWKIYDDYFMIFYGSFYDFLMIFSAHVALKKS